MSSRSHPIESVFRETAVHESNWRTHWWALTLALWSLLIGAAHGGDESPRASAERPNVVFILTDNQGAWTLGCYGNPGHSDAQHRSPGKRGDSLYTGDEFQSGMLANASDVPDWTHSRRSTACIAFSTRST